MHLTTEGIIGRAWQKCFAHSGGCPLDDPGRRKFHEALGFPAEKLAELRNPIRDYYAHRIDGGPGNHLGVLVLESLNPVEFRFAKDSFPQMLDCDRTGSLGERLARFIAELHPYFGDLSPAKRARM